MAKICTSSFIAAKPRVIIPLRMVRTVSEHYVWCSSEGTPPINISLMNSTTTLASRKGIIVWSKLNHDGNYSCVATNEVGTESKTFYVSLIGEIILTLFPSKCGYFIITRIKAVTIKR